MVNWCDPNAWANPQAGAIVWSALLAPMPKKMFVDYRVTNMSARELMESLHWTPGYFEVSLTPDRVWMRVTLDLTVEGHMVNTYGFLENRIEDLSPKGFWVRWNKSEGPGSFKPGLSMSEE